jgi:hypothetical protein
VKKTNVDFMIMTVDTMNMDAEMNERYTILQRMWTRAPSPTPTTKELLFMEESGPTQASTPMSEEPSAI